jgi:aldehyde dehydrogenase (NAD+)
MAPISPDAISRHDRDISTALGGNRTMTTLCDETYPSTGPTCHPDHTLPGHFIDGTWQAPESDEWFTVTNPTTEEVLGHAPDASAVDVDKAVRAAAAAMRGWSALDAVARGHYLDRLADEIDARADVLGRSVSLENGSPLTETTAASRNSANILRLYAGYAAELDAPDVRPVPSTNLRSHVARRPIGVAGLITPWNFPISILAMKLGPALLAGCAVVVKPAPETSLNISVLVEAIQAAGIPDGVINVVTGRGGAGQYVVDHPDVDKIGFTGSTGVGRAIALSCAQQLKSATLELGGKSAALVLEDVDIATFTKMLPVVSMRNTGQTCYAATRLLFPRSRYEELVAATVEVLQNVNVGDPLADGTEMGPVVSEQQRARVEEYVEIGRSEGAIVATGGTRLADRSRGYFVAPTLFRDVTPDMRIAREEIFGPVLVAMAYDSEAEGIAMANDSDFGLAGVVFSEDLEHAQEVAGSIEAGTVGVNCLLLNPRAPFGGWKSSGLGVELGLEAVEAYVRYQSITGPTP